MFRFLLFTALCFSVQSSFAQVCETDTVLFDPVRRREVPVALYAPVGAAKCRAIVIFSHGYGGNAPGSNKAYTYLTRELACGDCFVVSIQHELPDDEPLAMTGNLRETRLSNWERGCETILFTIAEYKRLRPNLPWGNTVLIGHSNGGDMTMLFAARYPGMIRKAVSLDNRRMPVPRVRKPAVATLRGCDYEADEGVLPDLGEQRRYGIRIVRLADIRHGDMDDKGSPAQHARICRELRRILRK